MDTWMVTKWYQHHYKLFSLKTFVTCSQSPSRGRKVALWTTIMPEPAQARLTSSHPPTTTCGSFSLKRISGGFSVFSPPRCCNVWQSRGEQGEEGGAWRRWSLTQRWYLTFSKFTFFLQAGTCAWKSQCGILKNLSYRTGVLSFVLPLNLFHIDKLCFTNLTTPDMQSPWLGITDWLAPLWEWQPLSISLVLKSQQHWSRKSHTTSHNLLWMHA